MAFTEITGSEYTGLLLKRLTGEVPELTWLKQCRHLLSPHLRAGVTVLDVGCAVGYAFNALKDFDILYTGLDIEEEYLNLAKEYFAATPQVQFIHYDITSPPVQHAEIVLCSAILEHCPTLMPALKNLVEMTQRILVLRTFLGEIEHLHKIPSPVQAYRTTHDKHNNQYAFKDVLGYLAQEGFHSKIYRDEYTDSLPQWVDQVVRTFYVIYAEKRPHHAD